jgi:hypothetical protein
MFKKNFWAKPAFLLPVLLAAALLAGCSGTTEPIPPPPPAKPVITSVVPASTTSLTVNWEAASDAASYEVYYTETDNLMFDAPSVSNLTGTKRTLSSLTNGAVYTIWVKAVNDQGYAISDPWKTVVYDPAFLTEFGGIWDAHVDSYRILGTNLSYDDGYSTWNAEFNGTIKYMEEYDTSGTSAPNSNGVIIIEYTELPESPLTQGTSNFEGIYFKRTSLGIKFASAYDSTTTDVLDLDTALSYYTQANEASLVSSWSGITNYYKEPPTVVLVDMGALEGVWEGDDNLAPTYLGTNTFLKISDHRLTVFAGAYAAQSQAYSGAIVDRTDPNADTGYIYIQITRTQDRGRLNQVLSAALDDYYVLYWYKENGKIRFSVYSDHAHNVDSNLAALKTYTALNPYFLEADDPSYEGEDDGLYSNMGVDWIYVGFTKQ